MYNTRWPFCGKQCRKRWHNHLSVGCRRADTHATTTPRQDFATFRCCCCARVSVASRLGQKPPPRERVCCTLAPMASAPPAAPVEDATPSPILGVILSLGAGCLVALSMVTQRYALSYEDYEVPVLKMCKLPRPAVWFLGLIIYGAANGLYCVAQVCGPLSLISSFFTLLLVFNLIFARLILGEQWTPPKLVGAGLVLLGALISVLGQPGTYGNPTPVDFPAPAVEALLTHPRGAIWFSLVIVLFVACTIAIIWFERTYGLKEDEEELREIRRQSLAANILVQGRGSVAFAKTPAQLRWKKAATSFKAAARMNSLGSLSNLLKEAGGDGVGLPSLKELKEAEASSPSTAAAQADAPAASSQALAPDAEAPAEPPPSPPQPDGAGTGTKSPKKVVVVPPPSAEKPPGKGAAKKKPKKKKKPLPPANLNLAFSLIYPASLGLLEGISHLTLKAFMSMSKECFAEGWPKTCYASGVVWLFTVLFIGASLSTVIWLKIVFTRYETTTALPIEYGTVCACSVLSGLLFYDEIKYMHGWQVVLCIVAVFVVLSGVAVSVRTRLGCGAAAKVQPAK